MGRHVCAAFAERGARVVAIARREVPQPPGHRFLSLDVGRTTASELASVLAEEGVDTVVNATLGWGGSEEEMTRANLRPVERLLAALRLLPGSVRLLQLGSVHEYGPLPRGAATGEDVTPDPVSLYGRSKLAASRLVLDAVRRGECRGTVLRMTNTIGPHPSMETFLGSLAVRLRQADPAEGLDITVAPARRDYVDVRDAAAAVCDAAALEVPEPVFNIGSGQAVDIQELVRTLVAISGLPPESVRMRRAEVRSQSPGADWVEVDASLARRRLGWQPRYSLPESLRAMWDTVGGQAAEKV